MSQVITYQPITLFDMIIRLVAVCGVILVFIWIFIDVHKK